jgi:ribosomal protein L13E
MAKFSLTPRHLEIFYHILGGVFMSLPIPVVKRKLRDGRIIEREGRGFSLNELREAGITLEQAKRLGIYIDKRRRSCRRENVEALRMLLRAVSEAMASSGESHEQV